MIHVPYRGDAPALTNLLGGQVQLCFAGMTSSIEYVRTSKLRALAVTTVTRLGALPDIPTVGEFVAGYEASGWQGLATRGGEGPHKQPSARNGWHRRLSVLLISLLRPTFDLRYRFWRRII